MISANFFELVISSFPNSFLAINLSGLRRALSKSLKLVLNVAIIWIERISFNIPSVKLSKFVIPIFLVDSLDNKRGSASSINRIEFLPLSIVQLVIKLKNDGSVTASTILGGKNNTFFFVLDKHWSKYLI